MTTDNTSIVKVDDSTPFINPETGEVIDIDNAEQMTLTATQNPDVIGLMLDTLDQNIRNAQDVRAHIGEFIIERMDMDATQTLHAGAFSFTVNGSSDNYETYDADALHASLSLLVSEDIITQAAMDKAIRVKREASKSGLNSLRALRNDRIDAAIDAATQTAAKRRRVTVKRAH
jgi:hypothetical protein